jgi:short-subunit dehydrogenase
MGNTRSELVEKYGPWAVIAGASEGIGAAFAQQLAEAGVNLVLLSRSQQKLEGLESELRQTTTVDMRLVAADLTAADVLDTLRAKTDDLEVGLLIYNAGATHGLQLFHERPMEDALELVDLNCRTPVMLAHHFGLAMRERKRGGMLFMSSLSALAGGSYVATYAGTKAFDIIFPQSLWHELAPHNVHVMSLVAGATRTPAMVESGIDLDDEVIRQNYTIMEPADVAREGLEALGTCPVWIAGEDNRNNMEHMAANLSREQTIEVMSMANAMLNDKPYIPVIDLSAP